MDNRIKIIAGGLLCVMSVFSVNQGVAQTRKILIAREKIELPQVQGGFDLMAYDARHARLFVSAQDNHSVEVIDLKKNKPVASLPGFNEPKWVFYHKETNLLYVATGKDGKVTEMDAGTFMILNHYAFKEKCNNLRYDPQTNELFVGVGDTFGAIGIIDLQKHKITGEINLAAYPKQFELTSERIYVNVPAKGIIQVIDRKTRKVTSSWPLSGQTDNVPMALDRKRMRLYIGCGSGILITCSAIDGKELARTVIHKEADGIYLDTRRGNLYVSCGEGFVDVLGLREDRLSLLESVPTRNGAGTSLLIPEIDRYILCEPQVNGRPAAIQIFRPAR